MNEVFVGAFTDAVKSFLALEEETRRGYREFLKLRWTQGNICNEILKAEGYAQLQVFAKEVHKTPEYLFMLSQWADMMHWKDVETALKTNDRLTLRNFLQISTKTIREGGKTPTPSKVDLLKHEAETIASRVERDIVALAEVSQEIQDEGGEPIEVPGAVTELKELRPGNHSMISIQLKEVLTLLGVIAQILPNTQLALTKCEEELFPLLLKAKKETIVE